MVQTTNRLFDELAKFMTDAAGAANGVRQEIETLFRGQAERFMHEMNVVQRDEFDALKIMVQKLREDNEKLVERIASLEVAQQQKTSQ